MGQVTHALLTRPPLSRAPSARRLPGRASLDLHVLGTPPAFILSQDQTLVISSFRSKNRCSLFFSLFTVLATPFEVAGVPRISLPQENSPFPKILFQKFSRIVVVYCSVVKVLSVTVISFSLAVSRDSSFMLPQSFCFVKNFFNFFSSFFNSCFWHYILWFSRCL